MAIPALTFPSFHVKAQAVLWCHSGELEEFGETTDMRLAEAIVRDLLAIGGRDT